MNLLYIPHNPQQFYLSEMLFEPLALRFVAAERKSEAKHEI